MSFNDRIVSILYSISSFEGGAHPNAWSQSITYDRKRKQFVDLNNVFKPDSGWEKMLSKIVVRELIEQQNTRGFVANDWIKRGAGPKAENFKHWNATKKGISIMFDAYSVGPYAAGHFNVNVPYYQIPLKYRGNNFYLVESLSYINGNPPNYCRPGLWTTSDEPFKLANVTGRKNQRAYFFGDMDGGPTNPASRRKAYLISGDEVIVKREYQGFSCVWYQSRKGNSTVGWIKTNRLKGKKSQAFGYGDWIGEWKHGESDISIKRSGSSLKVYGTSLWKGLGDNVHIGEIDKTGKPEGASFNLGNPEEQYDCLVWMTRLGKYLLVRDNLKCGGVNVTFNGVYVRKK